MMITISVDLLQLVSLAISIFALWYSLGTYSALRGIYGK